MSSVTPKNEGDTYNKYFSFYNNYVVEPVSAGLGIVPAFWGFQAKSKLQLGEKMPKYNFKTAFKDGFKAAPTIGVTVGTQLLTQEYVKKKWVQYTQGEGKNELAADFVSSVVVGAVSAPLLAVFNGMSNDMTVKESLKKLSGKQFGAIVGRETSFLLSRGLIKFVKDNLKAVAGDNAPVSYFSAFVGGAIGSAIGHPFDTALTLWQNDRKVEKYSDLFTKGVKTKAAAVGVFYVCYTFFSKVLTKKLD